MSVDPATIIDNSFTCPIDLEVYDQLERKPRILIPCGHSICERCLKMIKNKQCPVDRKTFNSSVVNFALMSSLAVISTNASSNSTNSTGPATPSNPIGLSASNSTNASLSNSSTTPNPSTNIPSNIFSFHQPFSFSSNRTSIINSQNNLTISNWYWQNDEPNRYDKYPSGFQGLIQNAFEAFKQNPARYETVINSITRQADLRIQSYLINFKDMLQINSTTSYRRNLVADEIDRDIIYIVWYFRDGILQPYESKLQSMLENAYQIYKSDPSKNVFRFKVSGRREDYEIDFSAMLQKNMTTLVQRDATRQLR